MRLETVKIVHSGGFCIINKVDFDSSKHQLYGEEKVTASLVDLNTATAKELIDLPTVGRSTKDKIVVNRPYSSLEEAKEKLPDLDWGILAELVEVN